MITLSTEDLIGIRFACFGLGVYFGGLIVMAVIAFRKLCSRPPSTQKEIDQ